jgi:hypothetical protein
VNSHRKSRAVASSISIHAFAKRRVTLIFIILVIKDFSDPEQLLSPENIDPEALQLFTMQAVVFATDNRLPDLQFASNYRGEPDVALFDFTTMYASENACRVIERKGHKLLTALAGDSLLEVRLRLVRLSLRLVLT